MRSEWSAPLVEGNKGGSDKPYQPTETPNNLISVSKAKVLVAVSEGEVDTLPTGQDIFLGGTPLLGPNGERNFGGVTWEWRSGTQDQTYIKGMPETSSEFSVGYTVTTTAPWTFAITDSQLSAVRVTLTFPSLLQQTNMGDIVGTTVEYAIDISTNGGGYVEMIRQKVEGKTNSEYNRTHRVDLPSGTNWQIRVRRLTPDSTSSQLQNAFGVKTFSEVIDVKCRYPNTALLFVEFDAELFGQGTIPAVTVRGRGMKVKVPSNYDPMSRTYSGVWDGTFKTAYTNNPAWIFYDIVINERYGLGQRVTPAMVDKWTLYKVAQYCDVLVSDGIGGTEPRYTCNVYIQSRTDAWKVLNDIVGIFNGMIYWDGNQIVANADMPYEGTPRTYGRSQTKGGFKYSASSEKSIYTNCLVSYDNPDDHYATAVEAVNELSLIRRYKGWSQTETTAIGCTSRGQAQRKGKYVMLTNSLNRMVSFTLGMEGYLPKPSEVFGVQDELFSGVSLSGRISSATLSKITLDRDVAVSPGDIIHVALPSGAAQSRTIQSVSGRAVTVTPSFSELTQPELSWYIERPNLKSQLFRCVKVVWNEEDNEFEVSGLEYNESKFGAIDNGARLESRPVSMIPDAIQPPVENITLSGRSYVEQGLSVAVVRASWDKPKGATKYEVQWRRDTEEWKNAGTVTATEIEIYGVYSGVYQFRVRAISAISTHSVWTESSPTQIDGKVGEPPALASFTPVGEVFAIRLNWEFMPRSEDGAFVEIWESDNVSGVGDNLLSNVPYPDKTYLKSGMGGAVSKFFRARLVDRIGNTGPWTDWTLGMSSADATEILDYLVDQINETHLGQYLSEEIDKISGNGPGSVNDRIEEAVSDITDALAYDPDSSYLEGDIVREGKRLYQAREDIPADPLGGNTPPNPLLWNDVGQIVEDAGALAYQVSVNTADITELDGKVEAQATSMETLRAAWREDDGSNDLRDVINIYDTQADIVRESKVRANADEAMASDILLMQARIGANEASVSEERLVRANADSALATSVTNLNATVAGVSSDLQSEAITRANADGALSTRIDTVTATANGANVTANSALTAINNTDGKLSAMWAVKLQVNTAGQYHFAGVGLGVENSGGILQSQFIVRADRFAILNNNNNGTTTSPFAVTGGQVFIDSAVIRDLSIDFGKISDSLQSTNYVLNTSGWKLWKNGNFEINGSVAGQGRLFMNNRVIKIWDGSGNLRVQLGDLSA